jgi:uncharacterized protein (DUF362 family)
VSIVKDAERRDATRRSLDLIGDDIRQRLRSRKVLIKPNFVSTNRQLASSHVDQIRGILDFFRSFHNGEIIVAEAACGDTIEAFETFGFDKLGRDYGVCLVDLNMGPWDMLTIRGKEGEEKYVRVSRVLQDAGWYRVSAAKMKTHDTVIVTLSVKNAAMGAVIEGDKKAVHQGIRMTNRNIAAIAARVWPDLAVIDGVVGMEGDGPVNGDPIEVGVTLASVDPLAADSVACEIMGLSVRDVGYLTLCHRRGLGETDLKHIQTVGALLHECRMPFRLHRNVERQHAWR